MTVLVTQRACAWCGEAMPPGKRASARTCSDRCRKAAHQERHKPGLPGGHFPAGTEPRNGTGTERQDGTGTERQDGTERQPVPAGWDAPGEPRGVTVTGERCPECGTGLHASPRGTRRACLACGRQVIPAGVAAPYQRGPEHGGRQVRTSRERDLDAIALARRKGVMLAQLAALAADQRLHEESRPVVDWFDGQVRAASGHARLDELAALLPHAGIRRRRWRHGEAAAITAGHGSPDDDGPDDDEDQADDEDQDGEDVRGAGHSGDGRPGSAVPAGPAVTWADALAALGLRLSATVGGCQVIGHDGALCGAPAVHHVTGRHVADAWVCGRHHGELSGVLTAAARP